MNTIYGVLLGFILDIIIGDPHRLPHPVRWIGSFISLCESKVRKTFKGKGLIFGGLMITVLTVGLSVAVPLIILYFAYSISRFIGLLFEGVICFYMLALKSLRTESMRVYNALEKGDTEGARKAVSYIVGRDTQFLDDRGITKAAVETVAENTSDGVIAPLFYMIIFGAVGGCVYKAVNTLDSMLGYRDEKYIYIGRIPARADDVLNFIPSRISALLMIFSSVVLRYDCKNALKIFIRDRYKHKSPNSAQTEAVCAGALDIQLAGDAYYFGKLYKKPYIGDNIREIEPTDIIRANRLLYSSALIGLITGIIIRLVIIW